jgi:hypothetical protein
MPDTSPRVIEMPFQYSGCDFVSETEARIKQRLCKQSQFSDHMKLSRIYQPRNALFWVMVIINLLSIALAWVARSHELAPLQATLVSIMAVANAVVGTFLMLRLTHDEPADNRQKMENR